MRLGVLITESAGDETAASEEEQAVLDLLRAKDVDVVLGHEGYEGVETGATPGADEQAKRLARADVDGALLFPAWRRGAASVALHLAGVPLLCVENRQSGSAYETLTQLGAPVDRLAIPLDQTNAAASAIEFWLRENSKTERQRGQEAALKLYGQALGYDADTLLPDPPRFLTQFGLLLRPLSSEGEASVSEAATPEFPRDAYVLGGINAVMTVRLLQLVSGPENENKNDVTTTALPAFTFGEPNDRPATFAAITRIGERFRCVVLRGSGGGPDAPPRLAPAHQGLVSPALSTGLDVRWLSHVAGDHVGALRAACRALDIEALVLR